MQSGSKKARINAREKASRKKAGTQENRMEPLLLLLGTGSVRFLLVGRHVFSTPIFGLLLDLEGHRAKGLQVRHTLSTSYSALVGQLFQPN